MPHSRPRRPPAGAQTDDAADRLFALSPDLLCQVGADGYLKRVNPAFERTLGWSSDELLASPLLEFVHPDDRASTEEAIRRRAAGAPSQAIENRYRCRDGSYRWLSWRGTPPDEHGLIYGIGRDVGARRQAEAALRASEELLASALDNAPIGMALTSPEGRWMRVNRALCEIVGYDEAELLATDFQSITHPDDLARSVERKRQLLAGERASYEVEKRYLHRQGHPVWVSVSVVLVQDAESQPLYLLAQIQDVTERKRAELALRESEARYRTLVETAYEGVWAVDRVGTTTYVNARLCQMLGHDAAELLGRPMFDFMPAAAAFEARTLFARRQRGIAELHDLTFRRRDGGELFALVATSPLADGDGAFGGVLAMITDISERRSAAQRLEESEQRYRSLFANHPDAVFSFDMEGRFVSANPACEVLSGYRPEGMLGESFAPLLVPEHREAAFAHFQAAAAGTAQSYEVDLVHAAGRRVQLAVTNIPIVVRGRVVGVYGIARDLTAQRALEAQLRQAQKMEAVGRLAGGVAHDFNNLLMVIQSCGASAAEELSPAEEARADLEAMLTATRRAAELTRQLLAFGRQQVLQPRLLDVNEAVANVAGMLRRVIGEDITLETQLDAGAPQVHADPGQLEQVLMNLAVNARDAMPGGGTLRLRTGNVAMDAAAARGRPGLKPGEYVSLVVEDTGTGIEPAALPHIFEPFFTTRGPGRGTGLGLATVYGIVTQSGGSVAVDGVPGGGSRFTVLLPRAEAPATAEASAAPPAPLPRGTETVLLVEDEAAVRSVVRRMLERQGYVVREAASGDEALGLADVPDRPIDLLLTDVVMPGRNGRALAESLVARCPGLRVLYMSGYTDDEILRRGLMRPGTSFLEKPFTPARLARAVRQALDGPGYTR